MYCSSLFNYKRNESREVNIGDVPMGGKNPVRIQSMTNTDTHNIKATISQSIEIIEAGADYVRVTVPTIKHIESLREIKNGLRNAGFSTPLIADVHFNPKVAELAAAIVEKVRINPGNYIPNQNTKTLSDSYYIEGIRSRLLPLINICKTNGTCIRIGTNHGSLSERIMAKYGDTAEGMVFATLEFLNVCANESFHNVVVSLKSSNTRIMVQACRLLVEKMNEAGMNYPLHLGVTEAGDGEDGRLRSSVGIGALLADGIGDTIRVSLSESPAREIPVAMALVEHFAQRKAETIQPKMQEEFFDPYNFNCRDSFKIECAGSNNLPIVINSKIDSDNTSENSAIGGDMFLQLVDKQIFVCSSNDFSSRNCSPVINNEKQIDWAVNNYNSIFYELNSEFVKPSLIQKLNEHKNIILIANNYSESPIVDYRKVFYHLHSTKTNNPVILKYCSQEKDGELFAIKAAAELGSMFIDGFGNGIWLENSNIDEEKLLSVSYGILQAARVRFSRTEYISCPGCGRTLFNLEKVIAQVKQKTMHLKGLKIAIMGCIVNGPGEMADADYGYVGAASGKVNLYKQKVLVKKNIPEEEALNELISLIKENDDWIPK